MFSMDIVFQKTKVYKMGQWEDTPNETYKYSLIRYLRKRRFTKKEAYLTFHKVVPSI